MAAAGQQQQQHSGIPPLPYGHLEQQMYQQPQQPLYQQQQVLLHHQQYATSSVGNNVNAPPMPHYADPDVPQPMPPLDYQQQLEMELEHQQRQFQQQFLEQYRQMQMQQPQDPSMQGWVDDGFTDQASIPASYHMAGFQDTPYNPNLPHPNAGFPPQHVNPTGNDGQFYYQQQHLQSRAESIASKRRAKDRPWLNASASTNNNGGIMPAKAATRNSANNNVAAASSSSESEGSDSSSETSSSDESAYNIDSDEERSKTSVPSASLSSRTPANKSHRASRHLPPTPKRASSSQVPVSKASGERSIETSGKHTANDADDDDDLPLSVISSNSTHKVNSLATVRRTKSAMPASSPSPRSRFFGTITHKLPSMLHRNSLKQSKSPRSKTHHETTEACQQRSCTQSLNKADFEANSEDKAAQLSGDSANTDDEDQPLDQIKSDLEAGTKHALAQESSETGSVHNSLASSRKQGKSGTSENEQAEELDKDGEGTSGKKRLLSERQMRLLQTLKSSMVKANHQQDSSSSEGPELSNASASEGLCTPSLGTSLRSRSHSQLSGMSNGEESVHESVHTTEERDSDAASYKSQRSHQSLASRHTASPQPAKDVPAKHKKERSYLPTGFGLPGLPVRSRVSKARAAVQYVALADIAENTERAQRKGDLEHGSDEESGSDRDIDDTEKEKRLRRKLSRKDGAPFLENGQYDAQSLVSRNTASSSGGTLMEILRTGPVELLTASTDHSGSKAAIEMLLPEDYGDIDQLLSDLDGIMSGSLAARRRFSLAVMRRSIAVDNGLVEPIDYYEPEHAEEAGYHPSNVRESYIEFKPLEIAEFDTGGGSLLSEGLGLDNILLHSEDTEKGNGTGNDFATNNNTHDDDDTQPLSELALKHPSFGELETQMEALDAQHDAFGSVVAAQPPFAAASQYMEQSHPRELTRAEKVNKALEKLEVLNVRKISIRIYIQDAQRYYTFSLTKYSTCEMLIGDMKKSKIVDPDKDTWALFEL
ncbi:hypothetical protein GGI22_001954, partial [Coemansia erecta]